MTARTVTLTLDEDDWNTIQAEVAKRQARRILDPETGRMVPNLPEGNSDILGASLAECVRDLDEYRTLYAQPPE